MVGIEMWGVREVWREVKADEALFDVDSHSIHSKEVSRFAAADINPSQRATLLRDY
jgi:hypothetical protein